MDGLVDRYSHLAIFRAAMGLVSAIVGCSLALVS